MILAGCSQDADPETKEEPGSDPLVRTALTLYKQQCASCHGGGLKGRVGPNLRRIGARMSQEEIAAKITDGGGGMPAFKQELSTDEIGMLTEWLAAKR
ncbi:c-type cytochrome [Paenibacillus methanolicus]|nr:cytochrome c [Paenibacillus methanolicus]